jgi:hypothetical protein
LSDPKHKSGDDVANEIFGSGDDVANQLFGAAETPPVQDTAAIEHARELVANQPLRGDQRPQNEDPWYTNAFRDAGAPATFAENLVPANLADEIGAGAIGASPEIYAADGNQGYQGIPAQTSDQANDYAAGSQFEDNRRTLEAEKAERDAAHPTAATAGQMASELLQTAALPEAALTTGLGGAAAGAGLTAANYMGQGSGDLDQRAGQALQTAEENPFLTVASVAAPAVAGTVGGAASRAAPVLAEKSAINRAAAVMTPGQRATYAANKGGKQGLVKLGNDIEAAGLHKSNPEGGWWSNLLPASSENMYDNALALKAKAGKQLGAAEDTIAAASPPIKVGNISKDLRGGADDLANAWTEGSDKEALYRNQMADRIDQSTTQPPIPGAEGPSLDVSGELPFQKAVKQRRDLDKQTNFTSAGGIENAGMKDQVHRQVGAQLRQNIRGGLDEAAAQNPSLEQPVKDWNSANKDFSLASTVEDPALVAMQKEYGGNLGLRDMATASAAQAMGIPGPLAMAAGKALKGGRGANALAGTQKNLSKAFGVLGTAAGPSALATSQTALPNPEVVRQKNQNMKDQLSDALSEGWDWFKGKVVE